MRKLLKSSLAGLATLALIILIRLLMQSVIGDNAPPLLFFLFAPLIAALFGGAIPGIIITLLSALASNYLFMPPTHLLVAETFLEPMFLMFFLQAAFTILLGSIVFHARLRKQNDLQRQQEMQLALSQSEKRYRSLVAAISSIVWTTDAHGAFVEEQPSWQAYTGQTWDECQGWGWIQALPLAYQARVQAAVKDNLDTKQVFSIEAEIWSAKHGQYRHVMARAIPIQDQNGKVTEWIGVTIDIHEQKTAAIELKKAKEAAESANRAKTQFLANMSHEIRTPLSAIIGFNNLILEAKHDEHDEHANETTEHAMVIKRNAEQLFQLVNEALDVSKIEADHLDIEKITFSLDDLLAEVIAPLTLKAKEKDLELSISSEGPIPPTIISDPTRLRQILLNVIGNAIKFTKSGGVTIVTKFQPAPKPRKLEFVVSDTGIGLTPEQQERLFKPFSQADESTTRHFGGTGLGLYLSQRLAQLLGGDCTLISSSPAGGSSFRVAIEVELPQDVTSHKNTPTSKRVALEHSQTSSVKTGRATLQDIKILLVEDAPDNQILITHLLTAAGAQVETASNGLEAIEKATSGDHDIVIMDVQMPGLDGLEATRRLRDRGYKIPIIALTALAMKTDRARCLAAGFSDYLPKPIDRKALIEKIVTYIDY